VVRARTGEQALRKAEVEAKKYASNWHRNPYGQRVRTRYLGCVDAYHMFDDLRAGAEVFSDTEVVPRRVSDSAIVDRQVGRPESKRRHSSRRNILNIAFNAPAPGVSRTARESSFLVKRGRREGRNDA
jgi:hypothetical protein